MHANFEMKKSNTLKFFSVMRRYDSLSRREIAEKTGLSWGSISAISTELLQRGVLSAEKEASAGGRPADKLTLHPSRFLQLGIDVNSIGLYFVVVNLRGNIVFSDFLPILSREKDDLLNVLCEKTQAIVHEIPDITGINLSMQGKIDRKTGVSLRTNFFKDWKNVPLVTLFEERFRIPTRLYHDPDCLLAYHLQSDPRLHGKTDGYAVRIDDGIGMARLIGGKLYETGETASFELGHTIAVPNGRACPCGKHGCLETYAAMRGMKEAYAETTGKTANEFAELLKKRDESVAEYLQTATVYMGIALANLFTLSSPEFILLDGMFFAQLPHAFPMIRESTEKWLCDECNLILAPYKAEAPAIGACLLTIEKTAEEILFDL